ncbi:unnamed protein product [Agarophyton chilense]
MNQPTKYDPPDSVVAPAFRELFDRLRRAQISNMRKGQITAEERKAFEYGVAERQKVLGHSLFLVFAQWALYRQAISRIKSRAIRLTYAMGSVVSTSWFVQRRAATVSKDTFAHIITTNMDSALGNEARIILAELEGPEGPYFRQVCRKHDFTTDFSFIPMDDEQHDLHPQFRLKPRLLAERPPHPQIPVLRGERSEMAARSRSGARDWRKMQPQTGGTRRTREESQIDRQQTISHRTTTATESRSLEEERFEEMERARERRVAEGHFGTEPDQRDSWGTPFDFSKAAKDREEAHDYDARVIDSYGFPDEERNELTPSQRRAAERRGRRLQAQARAKQTGDDG